MTVLKDISNLFKKLENRKLIESDIEEIINLDNFSLILQFGAAIGSVLYGLLMLFKKKSTISNVELK